MALIPSDKRHEAQIAAGTIGRRRGHDFEKRLAEDLTLINLTEFAELQIPLAHVVEGQPAVQLLAFVLDHLGRGTPDTVHALWLGGLAIFRALARRSMAWPAECRASSQRIGSAERDRRPVPAVSITPSASVPVATIASARSGTPRRNTKSGWLRRAR